MPLFAQHGYGKGDKIERGYGDDSIQGVIISARDESHESLPALISGYRTAMPNMSVMLDPQFYVSTIIDANARHLLDYPYFYPDLEFRNFASPADLTRYVEETLAFQQATDATHILSPTVNFAAFGDMWNGVSFMLATEACRIWNAANDDRPLLVSFVIDESAMADDHGVDQFLDLVTSLDCTGVYFLLRRANNAYSQQIEPEILSSLLYISYVISELNDLEIHFGYTDMVAPLLHAAGATSCATGWYNGLRQFTFARFEPSSGGRAPLPRYTSSPLMNVVKVTPDLDQVANVGAMGGVLTGTSYDGGLNIAQPSSANWPSAERCLHHWEALDEAISDTMNQGSIANRLNYATTHLQDALALYNRLTSSGVTFDDASGSRHLNQWIAGLDLFRDKANV